MSARIPVFHRICVREKILVKRHRIAKGPAVRVHLREAAGGRVHIPSTEVVQSGRVLLFALESVAVAGLSGAAYAVAESVEYETIRHGAGRVGQVADASAAVSQVPELAGRVFSRNKLEAACVEDRAAGRCRAQYLRVAGRIVDHIFGLHAVRRFGDAVPECVVVIGFCQGAGDTVGLGLDHAVLAVVRVTRDQYTALVLRNQVAGILITAMRTNQL